MSNKKALVSPKIEVDSQPTEKVYEAARLLNEILATVSNPNVSALLNQPKKKGQGNEARDLAEFAVNELYGIVCILSDVVQDNMKPTKDTPNVN